MSFLFAYLNSTPVLADDFTMSITTSGAVDIAANPDTSNIDSSEIKVTSTCPYGYNLVLNTSISDNNLYLSGNSTLNTTGRYFSASDGVTALNQASNTWGYLLSNTTPTASDTFLPVPSINSPSAILKTEQQTISEDEIDDTFLVYYGANASHSIIAGVYQMDNEANTNTAGGLLYFLTASPSCAINIDIAFNKNLDGQGSNLDPDQTVSNFPNSLENTIDYINRNIVLSDKIPTRGGYAFSEWNTEPDGSGYSYNVGDTIHIGDDTLSGELEGSVTLYAIWRNEVTFIFDGNGIFFDQAETKETNTVTYANTCTSTEYYGYIGNTYEEVMTSNINTGGDQNGAYTDSENISEPITITGADKLKIVVTYGVTAETFNATIMGGTADGSGGRRSLVGIPEYYKMSTSANASGTETYIINGDTVSFDVYSYGMPSSGYDYGFYARVYPIYDEAHTDATYGSFTVEYCGWQVVNGEYKLPIFPANSTFKWFDNDGEHSFGDELDIIDALESGAMYDCLGGAIHLYAAYQEPVIIVFDGNGLYFDQARTEDTNTVVYASTCIYSRQVYGETCEWQVVEGEYRLANTIGEGVVLNYWESGFISAIDGYLQFSDGEQILDELSNNYGHDLIGQTIALHANWDNAFEVTINMDSHVTSVGFYNVNYGAQMATTNGMIVSLRPGVSYTISASFDSGYLLDAWGTTVGGVLGSTTVSPTTYTVTDDTILSLTSRAKSGTANLDTGQNVNAKMKSLAEETDKPYSAVSSKIKALKMANSLPDGFTPSDANTISLVNSNKPVYIFFDNTNNAGIMYFYSEANINMNSDSGFAFYNNTALSDISALSDWGTNNMRNTSYMFYGASSLADLDALSGWNTSGVRNMSAMFYDASSITNLDALSNWNTSSATNMSFMFDGASALSNVDGLSDWNTGSVINMNYMFYGVSSLADLDALSDWNTGSVKNMSAMFYNVFSITDLDALSDWDTSSVTNMSFMFDGASSITNLDGLSDWVTSSVENMSYMFYNTTSLNNIDGLSDWVTSNATNMNAMFDGASSITNLDALSDWDTSSVENMSYMFYNATSLNNIDGLSDWITSSAKNMSAMFYGESSITNLDALSDWDTSSVADMSYMFYNATSLNNIDGLSDWVTSSVINMSNMFRLASSITNLDALSDWDTSSVTNMSAMFHSVSSITNLDALSDWDTSSVADMSYMFYRAISLSNVDALSDWDIRAVVATNGSTTSTANHFFYMFYGVPSLFRPHFTKRLGTWDSNGTFIPSGVAAVMVTVDLDSHISSVSFYDATYGNRIIEKDGDFIVLAKGAEYTITAFYDIGYTIDNWSSAVGTLGSNTINPTTYQTSSNDTLAIISAVASTSTVTVNMDSHVSSVSFSAPYYEAQVVNTNNNTVTIINNLDYSVVVDYEFGYTNGTMTTTPNGALSDATVSGITYTIVGDDTLTITSQTKAGTAILDTGQVLNAKMKSLAEGTNTTYNTVSSKIKAIRMASFLPANFIPSEANTVSISNSQYPIYIFFDNTNDVGIMYFYTEVKNIYMNSDSSYAFYNNADLSDISAMANWNTSNVTNMSDMFRRATSLVNLNALSDWDTSNVTNMGNMFRFASSLTNLNALSDWDTSDVKDMSYMFMNASSLTNLNGLSGWDTSSVVNMIGAFYNNSSLTDLNALSDWDTSGVTDMSFMFDGASSLTNLNGLSGWDTSSVVNMSFMFNGASSLTNLNGLSGWDTSSVTDMTNMFRFASSLTNADAISNWDIMAVTATDGSAANDSNNFYQMFNNTSSHPNFTKRLGVWNSDGTFISSNETVVAVTIGLDSHVTSITFYDSTYGSRTVTSDGDFITLVSGCSYTITANIEEGFEFSGWSATNGTLGSASANPTTFIAMSDSTLTVVSVATSQNNQQNTPQNTPQNIPANIEPSLSPQSLGLNNDLDDGANLEGNTTYTIPYGVSTAKDVTSFNDSSSPAISVAAVVGAVAGASFIAFYVLGKRDEDDDDEDDDG